MATWILKRRFTRRAVFTGWNGADPDIVCSLPGSLGSLNCSQLVSVKVKATQATDNGTAGNICSAASFGRRKKALLHSWLGGMITTLAEYGAIDGEILMLGFLCCYCGDS